jgi:hypothetical protein
MLCKLCNRASLSAKKAHDAGVDANDYFPISFEEVHAMMEAKGVLEPDEVQLGMIRDPWVKENQ